MEKDQFEVKRERFSLEDRAVYLLQGMLPDKYEVKAFLGQESLEAEVSEWANTSVLERFADLDGIKGMKVTVKVRIPEHLPSGQRLTIQAEKDSDSFVWFTIDGKALQQKREQIPFFVEEERVSPAEGTCRIRGWAVDTSHVEVTLLKENGEKVPCTVQRLKRPDVAEMYKEFPVEETCGFYIEAEQIPAGSIRLHFQSDTRSTDYKISLRRSGIWAKKVVKYYSKGTHYLKTRGTKALMRKVFQKVEERKRGPVEYQKWLPKHLPDKAELERQRREVFAYAPKISVVVPLYRTPKQYLGALVESLLEQTYPNWELCLSDGSGKDSPLSGYLEELQRRDGRIKVVQAEEALKISENTNRALAAADGDYIAFADHDDVLTPHALYECVRVLNQQPPADVIYSDEDKMSMDGHKFFQPHFKPDFNIDLLRTVNYICHLFVVKRSLQKQVGDLREEFDGAQDYDFIFRCVEKAEKICHIPKILYHWRSHENSTSENPESKLYAFEAGERAIQAHYDRLGIQAEVSKGEYLGLYRTRYHLDPKPLVSIIIPNKDHIDDLKRCIDSIEQKSRYENYEYIIVENNSTEEETFAFYRQLEEQNPKAHVVYYKGKFNYSAINNFGAGFAKGEYLWLLNNDTSIINEDCIEELVGYCSREDVGIVGARLYYEDDTIQHAGVVIGFGGIAGHCFVQHPRGATGYCHRIICAQDYSAVTAACMMVKRRVFDAVGGLTEELEVAFNDIDFCMKVRRLGKLVVYNPYAELYHYESKSRGLEDTPEKIQRFQREIATFERRWPEILRDGDPYYNPNLTLESQDFSLKRI